MLGELRHGRAHLGPGLVDVVQSSGEARWRWACCDEDSGAEDLGRGQGRSRSSDFSLSPPGPRESARVKERRANAPQEPEEFPCENGCFYYHHRVVKASAGTVRLARSRVSLAPELRLLHSEHVNIEN